MEFELAKKYEDVRLTPELRSMFTDIVMGDEATLKTFLAIAKHTTNESIGITIKQIIELVKIDRRGKRGHTFETIHSNIDRKHAERVVDKLLSMGLCYYHAIPPSKLLKLTIRGLEVAGEIKVRLEKAKKGADSLVQA
ncbi:hypothetical protein DNHGIG_40650 [Collibacillus ludicampi]|uniref:Uncharacterized protein n=1 Tax=Collibacillus ludicampi TaxID=2771369 RepID=A0AAV4LL75_9BACL|nr:hypothetical protein [Collibacillus ludicampi]GIM48516.1 hypothetical protein DNHGIG_40650 [Collibacillus ludicampi]